MGLQFENLVLGNLPALLAKAGLSHVPILNAGPYAQRSSARRKGCQIDLLIRTRQSLYVFEIKFRQQVQKSVIAEVQQKIERLKAPSTLSVRKGLVYQGELHPEIQTSDYFDFLVPFEEFLQ
jgi:hypothetical protein